MSDEVARVATGLAWILYLAVLLRMLSTRERSERKRDRKLQLGLSLQSLGCLVLPLTYRPLGAALVPPSWPYGELLEQGARVLSLLTQYGSVWMTFSAIRTLGRQWSLSARVVEGHELIRTGPYGLVRHPIYTALMGMTIGGALTLCTWQGVLAAAAFSLFGSIVRVQSEERLMHDTFGEDYVSYSRSVPALVPWPRFRRAPTTGI